MTNKHKTGFTLIEILLVISIIGLLSSLILVGFTSARRKARNARRIQTVQALASAMDLYFADNFAYPHVGSNCWNVGNYNAPGCSYLSQANIDALMSQLQPYISNSNTVKEDSVYKFQVYTGSFLDCSGGMNGSVYSKGDGYYFFIPMYYDNNNLDWNNYAALNDGGAVPYYFERMGGDASRSSIVCGGSIIP